jgi:hypothetical protein
MICVPYEQLKSVIRGGGVLLIAIESYCTGASQEHSLRVEARSIVSGYVAVAHV